MAIYAYRKKTINGKLTAFQMFSDDEHAFFYEGDTYVEAEKLVEEQTNMFCSGPVLFLVVDN